MGKIKLNYAICKYTPDLLRGETINVGIVFHYWTKDDQFSQFVKIKNRHRLRSFDDEYDKEYIDMVFDSLSFDFDFDTLHELEEYRKNEFENIRNDNFLETKIKYYVNEFSFTNVRSIYTTNKNISKDIEELKLTYLYYDKPKGQRVSTDEVRKLISKHYIRYGLNQKLRSPEVFDTFNKQVFDFEFDNMYVKAFSLDYKRQEDLRKNIKTLLYDLTKNRKALKGKEFIIVTDNESIEEENFFVNIINKELKSAKIKTEIEPLHEYIEEIIGNGIN